MKKSKSILYVTAVLSLLGILLIYKDLPQQIPVNFNYRWEVSTYGDKSMAIILAVFTIGMIFFMEVVKKRDQRVMNGRVNDIIEYFVTILLILINWVMILFAKEVEFNLRFTMSLLFGISFLVIGNYLPKVKKNWVLGIRTPWTLMNEVSWRKTHRVGGYIFVLYGFLFLITCASNSSVVLFLMATILGIGIVFLILYSYIVYRKEIRNKK